MTNGAPKAGSERVGGTEGAVARSEVLGRSPSENKVRGRGETPSLLVLMCESFALYSGIEASNCQIKVHVLCLSLVLFAKFGASGTISKFRYVTSASFTRRDKRSCKRQLEWRTTVSSSFLCTSCRSHSAHLYLFKYCGVFPYGFKIEYQHQS